MAASGMKEIKRRMKSVENTMQITKAMELVASSKLRKAKERQERSEPYFNELYTLMSEIAAESQSLCSIYTEESEKGDVLLIIIAGDRGLAGGFNHSLFQKAEEHIQVLTQMGRNVQLIPIGKKAVEHFERTPLPILTSFIGIAGDITLYKALDLSELIMKYYNARKITGIELFYNDYVSPLKQEPRQLTALPVPNLKNEGYKPCGMEYEPSPLAVFEGLVPQYLSGLLYCAIVDSFAAEQAARRIAMQNATDNATTKLNDLSLEYNRARQSAITQEITEIIGGANAQTD